VGEVGEEPVALRRLERAVVLTPAIAYDGAQLRPHFLRSRFGTKADAIVAFRGPCEVRGDKLVDLDDRAAGAFIFSPDMLHVMVERFDLDLVRAVLLQRLMASSCAEIVAASGALGVRRRGNDVYVGDRKLNVSIAARSPVSTLLHFGVNVDAAGAPVPAIGLNDLKIDPESFATALLSAFDAEVEETALAVAKAAPAHGADA
jgi:uncharacterized protein